jgi:hypothetical protein
LNVGGKYNTPVIARGVAFVGTDRIQAFGQPASSTVQINAGGPAVTPFAADIDFSDSNPSPSAPARKGGARLTGFSSERR